MFIIGGEGVLHLIDSPYETRCVIRRNMPTIDKTKYRQDPVGIFPFCGWAYSSDLVRVARVRPVYVPNTTPARQRTRVDGDRCPQCFRPWILTKLLITAGRPSTCVFVWQFAGTSCSRAMVVPGIGPVRLETSRPPAKIATLSKQIIVLKIGESHGFITQTARIHCQYRVFT